MEKMSNEKKEMFCKGRKSKNILIILNIKTKTKISLK